MVDEREDTIGHLLVKGPPKLCTVANHRGWTEVDGSYGVSNAAFIHDQDYDFNFGFHCSAHDSIVGYESVPITVHRTATISLRPMRKLARLDDIQTCMAWTPHIQNRHPSTPR